MRAAVYIRVSTEEQRERQTIVTQREFAERYCKQNEISIVNIYADDGVTGTIPLDQRPEGKRLLADAQRSLFDTVLLYRLDRLGRDALLILKSVSELESMGIQVRSMTESFDQDPTGKFLMTILSGVAGLERATIIQRMVEGTNRMAVRVPGSVDVLPLGTDGKAREETLGSSSPKPRCRGSRSQKPTSFGSSTGWQVTRSDPAR